MKIKATAKELKNADVRFISLVKRGANRIPFRILKTDKGENQMIDLVRISAHRGRHFRLMVDGIST